MAEIILSLSSLQMLRYILKLMNLVKGYGIEHSINDIAESKGKGLFILLYGQFFISANKVGYVFLISYQDLRALARLLQVRLKEHSLPDKLIYIPAETVAVAAKSLFSVGVVDVGTTAKYFGANLKNIFDLATTWGAFLLM